MSDASVTTNWKSTAMAGVMTVGIIAIGAAAIVGGSVGVGRYLDARAISEMRPAVAQLMVQDTVRTVVDAESAYMSGLMDAYASGDAEVSREFRRFQGIFKGGSASPEYREAGARAQMEAPLSETQILELAREVIERHEGLRDLLQNAQGELSGTGLDRSSQRDVAALLIMDQLVRDGAISIAPRIAERIGELTAEALLDSAVSGRAEAVRALVRAGLTGHLQRSPSVSADAGNLANMAPGVDRLEIGSTMGQKHSLSLRPAGTYRNVAHVDVEDPFAQGVHIDLGRDPSL